MTDTPKAAGVTTVGDIDKALNLIDLHNGEERNTWGNKQEDIIG